MIDQLEELFTQTVDEGARRAFLRMMVEQATRPLAAVRLVATLRADYFDRPLGYPGFAEAIRGRTVALGAMDAAELGDAVRRPAAGVGVAVEPALVERITAEAELQPGALPLVQHTMAELFERRQTNTITLASFDQAGGLAQAVGRRAEAIYESFDERAREGGRRVFLRLVSVSEDHEDTRRRVRRAELEQCGIGAEDLDTVLDAVRAAPPAHVRPRPREPNADRRAGPRGAANRMGSIQGLDRRSPRGPADPRGGSKQRPETG